MPLGETDNCAALEQLPPFSANVSDQDVGTGADAADGPAAWTWAVLHDENTDFNTLIAIGELLLAQVRENSRVLSGSA